MRKTRKPVALGIALALVAALGIGGTVAWLTDKSGPVTNTFTVGDVEIKLTESPLRDDGTFGSPAEGVANKYQMIPGTEYKKDPTVVVEAESEACYLFVKFAESGNPSTYLEYTSTLTNENGWTKGDGTAIPADVWYRVVEDSDKAQSWPLLAGNKITVSAENVTKENMTAAAKAQLVYTAYAIQKANIADAETAWKKVSK